MGAPNHHLGLQVTGCQDEDARPVGAVRADVVRGPCGVGTRFPSPVSRYECEQVQVIYLALNSAHLVSGGRDNILGVGWVRIHCVYLTGLESVIYTRLFKLKEMHLPLPPGCWG